MSDQLEQLRGNKKIPFFKILKRVMGYGKKEWWKFLLAFLLLLCETFLGAVQPIVVQQFIDKLSAVNIDLTTVDMIIGFALMYIGITIVSMLCFFLNNILVQKAGQRIVYNLRLEVFEHIENMSQNQFNEMPVGSLVTRVANYTSSISEMFTDVLLTILSNTLTVIFVSVIIFTISWKLSLVIYGFAIVVAIYSFIMMNLIGKLFRKERGYVSDMNSFLSENLSGMRITQIFSQEEKKEKQFAEKNKRLANAGYMVRVAFTFYRPVYNFLHYICVILVLWLAINNDMKPSIIVAFYLYISRFFEPIEAIADSFNQIQRANTDCERLFNLLDVKPEVLDKEDAIDVDHFEGRIEFKNVWFAYEEEDWILKDVSFTIEPKQTVAFVGATGAGKTTILSLIVRNYEIQKGQILIDGIDITHIKVKSLRKAIGQMLQDVFLFSGTIKSNIALRDDDFTDEDIQEACDYVNATSFISKLPHKLDEEVVERGENFSAGQRQLLSFARTVLHKPQILILDEATANIDTETEVIIQESLLKMRSIGTMLVVAHRLSTIQHCDNIIVLSGGEIIEQGTHQALLKKKGYYYKLYQLQFEK